MSTSGSETGKGPKASGKQANPGRQANGDNGVRLWPVAVCTLVFVALGLVIVQPLGYRLGTSPSGTVVREGTARIESCEPSWLHLHQVQVCQAQVRWERDLSTETARSVDEPPVDRSVYALRSLSGDVKVVERCPSRENRCRVVTADHPDGGGLGFVPVLICIALGIVGLILGVWLSGRISRTKSSPPPTFGT